MAKHLNLSLGVSADTSQARAQLQALQKELSKLTTSTIQSSNKNGLTKEINEAITATAKLRTMLEASTNVNTGNLDLSKFSQQLKSSGMDLKAYANHLTQLGPAGEQAFMSLAKSVVSAEVPLKRSNALISETWTTLKNTARWQFSSSMLHGFMGSIQAAHGYAQDLNESLNNIRIVTGQNIDQMARFAEEANKAAKALSTTTTNYTNASLIYYQQGLDDSQVKERTDITVKMANAAGTSAETASDQLTAIWNNFADGSKSLEYYADAITALGAATASSTDEISGGLEKFAAVADTIGLSYEYATSALATITAETRQSEDVVGTALKTIFSRIQGLNLGETLDDGTTLNKYSAALYKVGIDIKDANGELKNMDTILNEMGSKWETLNNDQQIALAQTVAGVRQYNQLVALMDNWDVMQDNLEIVANSTGTLNEQAEIYAESWEASSDRVRASAEKIYASLMDEKFFIGVNNVIEKALTGVGGLIDSMNGFPGVLSMIGVVATTVFGKQMAAGINDAVHNFRVFTGYAEQSANKLRDDMKSAIDSFNSGLESGSAAALEGEVLKQEIDRTYELQQKVDGLTESQKKLYQELINIETQYGENAVAAQRALEAAQGQSAEATRNARNKVIDKAAKSGNNGLITEFDQNSEQVKQLGTDVQKLKINIDDLYNSKRTRGKTILSDLRSHGDELLRNTFPNLANALDKYEAAMNDSTTSDKDKKKALADLKAELKTVATDTEAVSKAVQKSAESTKMSSSKELPTTTQQYYEMGMAAADAALKEEQASRSKDAYNARIRQTEKDLKAANIAQQSYGQAIVAGAQAFSSAMMVLNGFSSIIDTLNNQDMSFGEKFMSVLTTMSMMIPSAIGSITALKKAKAELAGVEKVSFATHLASLLGLKAENVELNKQGKLTIANVVAKKLENVKKGEGVAATWAQVVANIAQAASMPPLLVLTLALVAAIGILVLAVWGIVKAFEAWKASTPEGKLNDAKERAEELNTALEDAKTSADALRTSLESYDSAVKTLDECTKGTEEFNEALQKVNNEVLDLMTQYPELASMINEYGESAIGRGKNGELTVADWAKQNLKDAANQRVLTAQAAAIGANQSVRSAQIEVDKKDLGRAIADGMYSTYQYDDSAYNNSNYVGSLIASNHSAFEGKTKEELVKTLTELFNDNGIVASADAWADQIIDLQSDFGDLTSAIEANTKATEIENQTIAANALANNETIQKSGMAEEISKASGSIYGILKEEAMKNLEDKGWGTNNIAQINGANAEAKKIFKEYLEAAGLEDKGYSLNDTTGDDDNRKFVYIDDNGDEKTISLEAMRETVATAKAMEELGASAEALMNKFSDLERSGRDYDQAMKNWLVDKNFEGSTKGEADALRKEVGDDVAGYLADEFGDGNNLTDEDARKYGYESANIMIESFEEELDNIDDAWDDVADNLSKQAKKAFNNAMDSGVFDELSLTQAKEVTKLYQTAFENGGREGAQELNELISDMFTKAGDDADELSDVLTGVDWQTTNVEALKIELKEAGVEVSATNEELTKFIELMQSAGEASLEAAQLLYAALHEIAEDLETGETITAEEFDALGPGYEQFFMLMADGTYKLIGDAEEFYDAINKQSLEPFEKNLEYYKNEIAKVQGLQTNFTQSSIQNKALDVGILPTLNPFTGFGQKSAFEPTASGATLDVTQLQAQLDFLQAINGESTEMAEWRDALAHEDITYKQIYDIQEAVEDAAASWDTLTEAQRANQAALLENQTAIASTATSMAELDEMFRNGTIGIEAYTKAYEGLDYEETLDGLDAEEVADFAEYLEDTNEHLAGNEKMSKKASAAILRMNRGVEDLADNFDDWSSVIENSTEGSQEYYEALSGLKESVSDLTGISTDYINKDFIVQHMEEIKSAATGDAEAIDSLKAALAEEIIAKIVLDNELDAEVSADVMAKWSELQAIIPDLEMGMSLSGDVDFINKLNEMIVAAGMSADQVNTLLQGMGFEASFAKEPQKVMTKEPDIVTTHHKIENYQVTTAEDGRLIPEWDDVTTTTTQPGAVHEGEVDAFALQTHAPGTTVVPKIDSITQMPTGVSNNYSSTNTGGETPKGGKTPKAKKHVKKDPSQEKNKSKEAERYHEVKNELEAINHELEMISKEKDRAFGQAKIDAINKETKALEKQRKAQEKYHNEIRDNLKKDQQALAKYGATFDGDPDNPNITNYDEMVEAQVNKYNAAYSAYIQEQNDAVDAYNKSVRDEAAEEAYENAKEQADARWEAAKDAYEEFMDDIAQYEDTVDLFDESEETLKDIENQLYDLELEKIEYKLQIKLDVADDELEYLEYLLSKTEDDAFKAAEAIANLEEQVGVSMDKIEAYKTSLNEIFEKHGLGEQAVQDLLSGKLTEEELKKLNLTEKEIEMIREAKNGLLEENQTLMELQKTMREKVTEAFEAFVEEIDKGIAKMEHLAKITDGYKNIIDLVGRKTLGISKDLMKTLNNTAIQNSMNTLAANQRKLEALSKSRADMEAKRQEAEKQGLTDTANYWAEQIELVDEKIREAQESSMDMIGDTLEKINEEFERAVNDAIASFEAAMSGTFGNLDALQDAYDRQSEIDERYIDDYTQIYELTKLTRNINNSIDDTQNIKGKQELKKLLNEINDIQAKGIQMSEYDLKYLQGKYDLKLAEIALEEAQNAKSQVRMVQDNEGNWGYMYTADQDKIDEAQQNYEDKLHALSQMTDEYLDETEAKILATQQEFAEAVAALKDQEWEDQAAFQQALDELTAYYQGKLAYLIGEEEKAINNNKDLMDDYTKTYGEDVAAQIQSNTDFVTSFDQTKLSYVTGIGDMQTYLQTFTAASNALLNEMGAAYSTWAIQVDTALGLIGSSVDTFAGDVSEAMGEISRESDQAKQDVDDAAEQMELDFKLVLDAAQNFETQYQTIVKGIIDQNELLVKSFNNALDAWSEFEDEDSGNSGGSGSSGGGDNGGNSGGGSSGGGSGAGSGNGSPDVGDVVTYTGGLYYGDSYGGGQTGQRGPGKQVKITQVKTDGRPYPIHVVSSDSAYGWLTASQLSGFDTGGYTGDWAGYAGKLALLHKKELILNEEDTSNFLSALGIVRDISQMIDLNAHAASYGLGLMSSIGVRDSAQTIEQQVTIHAEFPNASNHSEIEEAFNNLINTATQYANRKK